MAIEWTTMLETQATCRLYVKVNDGFWSGRDATPSDLAAALAAMGEAERAEVLEEFRPAMVAYCNESIARAEKAERERDEAVVCSNDWKRRYEELNSDVLALAHRRGLL